MSGGKSKNNFGRAAAAGAGWLVPMLALLLAQPLHAKENSPRTARANIQAAASAQLPRPKPSGKKHNVLEIVSNFWESIIKPKKS